MSNEKHTEKIKCPDCGTIQDATVEHTTPFYTYLHICTKCDFTIMESEWNVVPNEKQLTAMQELRVLLYQSAKLAETELNEKDRHAVISTFSTVINAIDKTFIATERQQLIDGINNMSNVLIANDVMTSQDHNATPGENYFNYTFKTQ